MILPIKDRGGRQASDPLALMPAIDYAGNDHPPCLPPRNKTRTENKKWGGAGVQADDPLALMPAG